LDKKYALIFSLLLAGLIVSDVFIFNTLSGSSKPSLEKATVSRVIDGDTLKLEDGRTVRLLNINSPEKGTPNCNHSSDFLKQFENKSIEMDITGTDKYKRTLARIYSGEDYLNLKLVQLGLASKFLVDKNELALFSEAEESAIRNAVGIWIHSKHFGCFESEIDKDEEFVFLENKCPQINLDKWMLKDESRKIYTFKNLSFERIILHSPAGIDNSTDIFWNNKDNIWNSDRDTLYLFDSEGNIVHHESYGY